MLWVHNVMDKYLKLEINNHPSISSEYVKFLVALHASFKAAQGLKKKEEGVEKKVSDLEKEVKRLNDLVRSKLKGPGYTLGLRKTS
jgi:hypothetical protein